MGNYGFNAQGNRANNYTPNYSAYAQSPYERMYQQMANSQQPQSYASNQYSAQPNQAATQSQFNGIMSGATANRANTNTANANTANNAAQQAVQEDRRPAGGENNPDLFRLALNELSSGQDFQTVMNKFANMRSMQPQTYNQQNQYAPAGMQAGMYQPSQYQAQMQPQQMGGMLGGAYGNQMGGAQNLANQDMANAYGAQAGGMNNAIMSGGGTRKLVSGLLGKF